MTLVLHQEPPELIGCHEVSAFSEDREGSFDVCGWDRFIDLKLTVKAFKHRAAITIVRCRFA